MKPEQYHALLRQDLCLFIRRGFAELWPTTTYLHNFHIDLIAQHLEDVLKGKTKRLIINLPPRGLKSLCASIAFPAYVLGHDPHAQIICASYGQGLSAKLSVDTRTIMQSDWYRTTFSTRLASSRPPVHRLETTGGGMRYATSVGGTLTGRGADILIIDDPLKPTEAVSDTQRKAVNDWFDGTLLSRLNDKANGAIIIIMQRLHEDDLVGHVLKTGDWTVLSFPAIAETREVHDVVRPLRRYTHVREPGDVLHPERESRAAYDTLERAMGTWHFAAQYQQRPAPLGGGIFKDHWPSRFDLACPPAFHSVLQSWDTAYTAKEMNDWSVCTTWGITGYGNDQRAWLIDVYRQRLLHPELIRAVMALAERFNAANVLIEDCASGTTLVQHLQSQGFWRVRPEKPVGDKVMRMMSASSFIEAQRMHIPSHAPWLADYLHELLIFPNGAHDDQVDSTSQAVNWLTRIKPGHGIMEYYRQEAEKLKIGGR